MKPPEEACGHEEEVLEDNDNIQVLKYVVHNVSITTMIRHFNRIFLFPDGISIGKRGRHGGP